MDKIIPEAKWKQIRGKVKERWGKLTDDDMLVINGDLDQLAGKLQEKYGEANKRVLHELREWLDQHIPKDDVKKNK